MVPGLLLAASELGKIVCESEHKQLDIMPHTTMMSRQCSLPSYNCSPAFHTRTNR